ncbi:MAG: patatin-like phospholipase family protein [Methylocella sp.]
MPKDINIALCLSGGGFRATLFHLGALKRLDELGLLARVRMLSAVSGGAVTAALFHRYVRHISSMSPEEIDNWERDGRPLQLAIFRDSTSTGNTGGHSRAVHEIVRHMDSGRLRPVRGTGRVGLILAHSYLGRRVAFSAGWRVRGRRLDFRRPLRLFRGTVRALAVAHAVAHPKLGGRVDFPAS